jgi:hypothetical protein
MNCCSGPATRPATLFFKAIFSNFSLWTVFGGNAVTGRQANENEKVIFLNCPKNQTNTRFRTFRPKTAALKKIL